MKQCKIYDIDNELYHGGILLEDGSVICGCCGSLLPADEINDTWRLEKIYDFWVDLTDVITEE